MSEAPCSNPKFLLHLHRASPQFTCVNNQEESRKSPFECKTSWYYYHRRIDTKIKYTGQNHLNNKWSIVYCAAHKQTNKYIQARREVGRAPFRRRYYKMGTISRKYLLTCRWRGSRTWGSICMFRYRRQTWWLKMSSRIEEGSKQDAGPARQREREREETREEKGSASERERKEIRDQEERF